MFVGGKPDCEGDTILRHPDKNPNTRGVAALAAVFAPRSMQDLAAGLTMAEFNTVLLALGTETRDLADAAAFSSLKVRVVLATHEGPLSRSATVLLPASSWAESDGTFVNATGLSQESEQAIGHVGDSRPAWKLVAGLAVRLGHDFGWRKLADVRGAPCRRTPWPRQRSGTASGAGASS